MNGTKVLWQHVSLLRNSVTVQVRLVPFGEDMSKLTDKIRIDIDACNQLDIIEGRIREAIIDMCMKRVYERNEDVIREADVLAVLKELNLTVVFEK